MFEDLVEELVDELANLFLFFSINMLCLLLYVLVLLSLLGVNSTVR